MKKNALVPKNLDELVFENRNKEYGAYNIRRSYSENVNKAVLGTLLFGVLIISIGKTLSSFDDSIPTTTSPKNLPLILENKPEIIVVTPPEPARPRVRQASASLIPAVTTAIIPDEPVNQNPTPVSNNGSTDGTLTDDQPDNDGAGNSTGTVMTIPPTTGPIDFAEEMPEYIGGLKELTKFIKKNIRYPRRSAELGINGKVLVRFVINADSTVTNVEVMRGISPDCDKEAVRVVASMPKWKPGKQHKVPVSVRLVLPITYKAPE